MLGGQKFLFETAFFSSDAFLYQLVLQAAFKTFTHTGRQRSVIMFNYKQHSSANTFINNLWTKEVPLKSSAKIYYKNNSCPALIKEIKTDTYSS